VHLTQFYRLGHLCAENYQSWWKFDEVLSKTIFLVFFKTRYLYLIVMH